MAKASGKARHVRDSLRSQVRSVVASAQRMRNKMTGMPIHADFNHLHKLNTVDKEAAAEIIKKYDAPQDNVINNPEILQQLQALAKTSEGLAETLDAISEDFKRLKKHGEGTSSS